MHLPHTTVKLNLYLAINVLRGVGGKIIALLFHYQQQQIGVGGQQHAPAALLQETSRNHCAAAPRDPWLVSAKNFTPTRNQSPNCPAHKAVTKHTVLAQPQLSTMSMLLKPHPLKSGHL
jgi:hypothetical protein